MSEVASASKKNPEPTWEGVFENKFAAANNAQLAWFIRECERRAKQSDGKQKEALIAIRTKLEQLLLKREADALAESPAEMRELEKKLFADMGFEVERGWTELAQEGIHPFQGSPISDAEAEAAVSQLN